MLSARSSGEAEKPYERVDVGQGLQNSRSALKSVTTGEDRCSLVNGSRVGRAGALWQLNGLPNSESEGRSSSAIGDLEVDVAQRVSSLEAWLGRDLIVTSFGEVV